MNLTLLTQYLFIILLGTAGSMLFKYGVDNNPKVEWTIGYWTNTLLTPIIFLSLIIMFLGRMMWILPLQNIHIGRATLSIMPLSVLSILIASAIFFNEKLSIIQILGVILGLISLIMMEVEA